MDAITVRFDEWTRYDPQTDRDVICLVAITGKGTYHLEHENTPSVNRAKKKLFQEHVIHMLEEGIPPGLVDLDA